MRVHGSGSPQSGQARQTDAISWCVGEPEAVHDPVDDEGARADAADGRDFLLTSRITDSLNLPTAPAGQLRASQRIANQLLQTIKHLLKRKSGPTRS
jgi:hypothetical protein